MKFFIFFKHEVYPLIYVCRRVLPRFQHTITAAFFVLCFSASTVSHGNQFIKNSEDLEKQRQIFSSLLEENKIGKINPIDYQSSLGTYPLFPYLEYLYLINRIGTLDLELYQNFFNKNESLASSSYLRKQLLIFLGNKKDWINFKKFYKEPEYFFSESNTIDLQCFDIQSQLENQNSILVSENDNTENPQAFLKDELNRNIQTIYLTGESLPDSCDPVIEKFAAQGLLSSALKLARIQLAIENNNNSLANFIAKSLDTHELNQFTTWETLSSKPELLKSPELLEQKIEDTSFNRFAIIYALKKIVKTDPPLALMLWTEQNKLFDFSQEEIKQFTEDSANYLYINNSEHTDAWLELSNKHQNNEEVNQRILVRHIKNKDWAAIIQTYNTLSQNEKNESIWQYWYSRSYIEYDQNAYIHPNAYRILDQLSRKRDYYGFLASFHLNNAPVFSEHSFPIKERALVSVASNIGIVRAHEFYMLKDRINASREWLYAIKDFTPDQKGDAAVLAYQWGWLEQAIISASKSNQFNNIALRFPLGFAEHVNFYASKYGIPNEWVFAVIRQESAYGLEAVSSVGALGLMQIMPSTGKVLARENKMKRFSENDLLNPEINIHLGTYYLSRLKKQYNGNMLLASAAYNAGPSRVNSWLKEAAEMDVEMWIETIPYKETRNYVKNILAYQIIYQQQLGREINSERLFLPLSTQ